MIVFRRGKKEGREKGKVTLFEFNKLLRWDLI